LSPITPTYSNFRPTYVSFRGGQGYDRVTSLLVSHIGAAQFMPPTVIGDVLALLPGR
jgi:hypothetical protein